QRLVALLPQDGGGGAESAELGVEHGGRITEAGQVADLLGEFVGGKAATVEQAGLAGRLQLRQALAAEVRPVALDAGQRVGFQESLHLLAEGPLLARRQSQLAAVPPGRAGQGDLGGPPGAGGGLLQGGIQAFAVVREAIAKDADQQVKCVAGRLAGETLQRDGRELQEDAHGWLRCLDRRRCQVRSSSLILYSSETVTGAGEDGKQRGRTGL